MTILAGTLTGMPLVYSGQESGSSKRLRFFEKDTVEWGSYDKTALYQTINRLHHEEEALWNGAHGAQPIFSNLDSDDVLAFSRSKGNSAVIVAINFGDADAEVLMNGELSPFEMDTTAKWNAVCGDIAASPVAMIPPHSASVCVRSN